MSQFIWLLQAQLDMAESDISSSVGMSVSEYPDSGSDLQNKLGFESFFFLFVLTVKFTQSLVWMCGI